MPVYKWRRRPTKYFGEVFVPFAQIELKRADGEYQEFALQIDSGAVVSLLRRSVADVLGIAFETGKRIEITSVGGGHTTCYVHEIETRFAENIAYPVPYAIAVTESVPNLLGRLKVFDLLQIDFDATFDWTQIRGPWLNADEKTIWDSVVEGTNHVLQRWNEIELSGPARLAVRRYLDRAGELVGCALGLSKLGRTYAGPLFIRAMFELALQFKYLIEDPEARAQQYLDFAHVTRYRLSTAIAKNPTGPISKRIASSPLREEGERRNEEEYARVRPQFVSTNKKGDERVWTNWYGTSIRQLAERLGWAAEYRVIYADCSSWAHGDPFSTQWSACVGTRSPNVIFIVCARYYAHMILKLADVGKVVLTSEQYECLKGLSQEIC